MGALDLFFWSTGMLLLGFSVGLIVASSIDKKNERR